MKKGILITLTVILLSALCGCGFSGNTYFYTDANKYSVGEAKISDTVKAIDIDWPTGNVKVENGGSSVSFSETANQKLTDDTSLHYLLDGTTLYIKFAASGKTFLNLEKQLVLDIPDSLELEKITINTSSASIDTDELTAKGAAFSTSSGSVSASLNCEKNASFSASSGTIAAKVTGCEKVTASTSSGNIDVILSGVEKGSFSASSGKISVRAISDSDSISADTSSGSISIESEKARNISADASSGKISITAYTVPEKCSVDTSSGDVRLFLPKNASVKLKYDTSSGDFESELPMKKDGKTYIFGGGNAGFEVDTSSGDLSIFEN